MKKEKIKEFIPDFQQDIIIEDFKPVEIPGLNADTINQGISIEV